MCERERPGPDPEPEPEPERQAEGPIDRGSCERTVVYVARGLTDGEVAQDGRSPRASACEAGDGPDSLGPAGHRERREAPPEVLEWARLAAVELEAATDAQLAAEAEAAAAAEREAAVDAEVAAKSDFDAVFRAALAEAKARARSPAGAPVRTIWPAPLDTERRAPMAAVPGAAPDGVEAPAPPDAAAPGDALEAAAAAGAPAAAAAAEAEAEAPVRAAEPVVAARGTREEHPGEDELPSGVGSSELARSLLWDPYPDCIMAEAQGGGVYDDSSVCWGQCGRRRFRLGEPGEGWYCCITCRDTGGKEHGPYCEERHRAWAERNPQLIPFPFAIPGRSVAAAASSSGAAAAAPGSEPEERDPFADMDDRPAPEPEPEERDPFSDMDDRPAAGRSRKRRRRRRRRAGSPVPGAAPDGVEAPVPPAAAAPGRGADPWLERDPWQGGCGGSSAAGG